MPDFKQMASRRVIVSLLDNFLGTYVSRYSQYDGYWLFGFLVNEFGEQAFDLLVQSSAVVGGSPLDVAAQTARDRFAEQVKKLRVDPRFLRAAILTIRQSPETVLGTVGGHACTGRSVAFVAQAVSDQGRIYRRERAVFVAPHDPSAEQRSGQITS